MTAPSLRIDRQHRLTAHEFGALFRENPNITIPEHTAVEITEINPEICREYEQLTTYNDQQLVGAIFNDILEAQGKCLYTMGGDGYLFAPELSQRKLIIIADKKMLIESQNLALVFTKEKIGEFFQNKDAEIIPSDTDLRITNIDPVLCQKILSQHSYPVKLQIIYQIFNDALKPLNKIMEPLNRVDKPFITVDLEQSTVSIYFRSASAIILSPSSKN